MEISFIYILIFAEIMLLLFGLVATFSYLLVKKNKSSADTADALTEEGDKINSTISNHNYINYIEQEINRNTEKLTQHKNNEEDTENETEKNELESGESEEDKPEEDKLEKDNSEKSDSEQTSDNDACAADEKQSKLLEAREDFLLIEKLAAENTEHDIHFWDTIYNGISDLLDKYKTTENTTIQTDTTQIVIQKEQSKEKVFYIETQGKKIDGEVNKLKDIIYEQENALSSMKKAMGKADNEHPEESESLSDIRAGMEALERQLNDSKMCMEVLEMENDRLQQEVDNIDARHNTLFEDTKDPDAPEKEPIIDLQQMKTVIEEQELKISQLIESIEELEIDTSQTDKLKETIGDFSRTAKEMMSCIAILEDENERLQASSKSSASDTEAESNDDIDEMKANLSKLEEELIKKDVIYAQLQDEFSSMETEYLAMYEAMHGDNS